MVTVTCGGFHNEQTCEWVGVLYYTHTSGLGCKLYSIIFMEPAFRILI